MSPKTCVKFLSRYRLWTYSITIILIVDLDIEGRMKGYAKKLHVVLADIISMYNFMGQLN